MSVLKTWELPRPKPSWVKLGVPGPYECEHSSIFSESSLASANVFQVPTAFFQVNKGCLLSLCPCSSLFFLLFHKCVLILSPCVVCAVSFQSFQFLGCFFVVGGSIQSFLLMTESGIFLPSEDKIMSRNFNMVAFTSVDCPSSEF